MTNSSSVQEHLKMKRMVLDTWTINEKLRLASFVEKNGNQNWGSVSRSMKAYFQDPDEWSWTKPRPPDWYSPKNCAQQFALLLDSVETPKRKKRSGGSEETQVQTIKRTLLKFRNDEIERLLLTYQDDYLNTLNQLTDIMDDDEEAIEAALALMEREKLEEAKQEEEHERWLKEREDRRIELERACRTVPLLTLVSNTIRRESSLSEPSSDADSPISEPLAVDVPEDAAVKITVPTPTSPLLTSLLKSPSVAPATLLPPPPVTPPGNTSILHSAITSPLRGVQPIAARINSSPNAAAPIVVSPNIKSLVSTALGSMDDLKPTVTSPTPSQGAPTLSMLLELPPSLPGKPLPVLPAPPPYSGHLGPPPPYSQATQYLQKQRAEQAAQAAQLAIEKELILSSTLAAEVNVVLPETSPKTDIDLDDIEDIIADVSRCQYNTTDHNYVEPKREEPVVTTVAVLPTPVPVVVPPAPVVETIEIKTEKNELDVFDFEEEENETKTMYVNNKKMKKEAIDKVMNEAEVSETSHVEVEEIVDTEITVIDIAESAPLVEEKKDDDTQVAEEKTETIEKDEIEVINETVEVKEEENVKSEIIEEKQAEEENLEIIEDDKESKVEEIVKEPVEEPEPEPEPEPITNIQENSNDDDKDKLSDLQSVGTVKRRRLTVVDSVPNSPVAVPEEEKDYRAWKKSVQMVHSRIESHKSASFFLRPITDEQAPDYSKIIRVPLELNTIKRNLENGVIRTSEEYLHSILQMFFNALMYNKTQDVVYKQAVEMQEDCLDHIWVMMDLRGETPTWWKRKRTQSETTKTRPSRASVQPNTRASVKSTKRASMINEVPRKKSKTED